MATEKQIEANRLNALKSTGPRTQRGKNRSRRNALRHGLLAGAALLKAECPRRFDDFVDGYYAEYQPRTSSERDFVNTMAVARWRALRLMKFEAVQIDEAFDAQDPALTELDNATRAGLAWKQVAQSGVLSAISRREASERQTFNSNFDRFKRQRAETNPNENPA